MRLTSDSKAVPSITMLSESLESDSKDKKKQLLKKKTTTN